MLKGKPSAASDFATAAEIQYVSRIRAAELLDCSPQTIDAFAKRGLLSTYKPGGSRKVLISLAELNRFMEASKIQ